MMFHTGIPKSKSKKKPGWQKRQDDYLEFLKKNGIGLTQTKKKEFVPYVPKQSFYRQTKDYPSFQPSGTTPGYAEKPERNQYSGDYLVGIATMHKSNAVPVGRDDNPTDYSTMRRN